VGKQEALAVVATLLAQKRELTLIFDPSATLSIPSNRLSSISVWTIAAASAECAIAATKLRSTLILLAPNSCR